MAHTNSGTGRFYQKFILEISVTHTNSLLPVHAVARSEPMTPPQKNEPSTALCASPILSLLRTGESCRGATRGISLSSVSVDTQRTATSVRRDSDAPSVFGGSEFTSSTQEPEEQISVTQPDEEARQCRKRALQHVATRRTRRNIVQWMENFVEQEGNAEHIASKAVKRFPEHFRGSQKANLQKASRWWKTRKDILKEEGVSNSVNHIQPGVRKQMQTKANSGRGRKRSAWVEWIHPILLEEFDRLRKAGLKFDTKLLVTVARGIISQSDSDFHSSYIDPSDGKKIIEKITTKWIQGFTVRHNIVIRAQTGKLSLSPEKQCFIEKTVAHHLGVVKRGFDTGELNEDFVFNMDETHFVINVDNGKTLGFRGDEDVKYADVVSGGESMTMVVLISGGYKASILTPMMIFKNENRAYPIRGLSDNVPGVVYRSGPRGWMDRELFPQWLRERRVIPKGANGEKSVIFLDNCGGHNPTAEQQAALQEINACLRFLPPNSTDLCQPADSFIISKIKDAWTQGWNEKRMELIANGEFQTKHGSSEGSGKLKNPGKLFFLRLAAQSVRKVNSMRDRDGLTYARKAMIRCGLSKNLNGLWEITQLFPKLQNIIKKYRSHFEGAPVGL